MNWVPDLFYVDHHKGVNLGIFLLVESAVGERHLDEGGPFPGGATWEVRMFSFVILRSGRCAARGR